MSKKKITLYYRKQYRLKKGKLEKKPNRMKIVIMITMIEAKLTTQEEIKAEKN